MLYIAVLGIVGAFIAGLLVGRKNPKIASQAQVLADKAKDL